MSAPVCIVYYGLRYEIPLAEIEDLETRRDTRMVAARQAGLRHYWGNFGLPEERYLLFIGAKVGIMGPENQLEVQLSDAEFEAMANAVRIKLASAGLEGALQLYIQWEEDV